MRKKNKIRVIVFEFTKKLTTRRLAGVVHTILKRSDVRVRRFVAVRKTR